jgi:RNA polymerase sigma-70 factor (ECF subfamily)
MATAADKHLGAGGLRFGRSPPVGDESAGKAGQWFVDVRHVRTDCSLSPTMLGSRFDEVLAGAQCGAEWAMGELWRDLRPAVLRYLRVMAPSAAEDLDSETWLGVARGLRTFEGGENAFRAWVFTIARHRLIDWRRRQAQAPDTSAPPEQLLDRAAADDPAEEALAALATEGALALIATLPAEQAEAVMLRVVAGLDGPTVAKLLGKRPGAVRVLCHRGLRRLAGRLAEHAPARGEVTP